MGAGTFRKVERLRLKNERRMREDRSAEGDGVWGGGVPLPSRLGCLVSVVSSSSGVWGARAAPRF